MQAAITEKCDVSLPWKQNFCITPKGTLTNNDGDGNGNGKKKKIDPFDEQNNNFAPDQTFFVHFLAVVA